MKYFSLYQQGLCVHQACRLLVKQDCNNATPTGDCMLIVFILLTLPFHISAKLGIY